MHAHLLIGNNQKQKKLTIDDLAKGSQKLVYEIKKIAEVRKLHELTKLSLQQKTTIIIEDFDEVSEAAQNAFLKALEEPQKNLTYILTAHKLSGILTTIHSRCQITQIGESEIKSKDVNDFDKFYNAKIADRILMISKIKGREPARKFLIGLIKGGSTKLSDDQEVYKTLKQATQTLEAIEQNGNIQLQLTNFVISV